ncbi:alpha-hydroxy acid oxidase [Mesorhizobium sp. M0701]|uniref:alpha-hydroxy acid oxidase n=1 Tax=Mesorhizobium sp. M0701 TaxID=2956989 RepID=UPI0033393BEC
MAKSNAQIERAVSASDVKELARKRLPKALFDYIEGGVEDEIALETNRDAFDKIRFLPRICRDVSRRSRIQSIFGETYNSPFGISPSGMNGLFRPAADIHLAEAAKDANIPFGLSGVSNASLEQIWESTRRPFWFQLYAARDTEIVDDMLRRAQAAGSKTLIVTADVPVSGIRERNIRNRVAFPYRPSLRGIIDAGLHWAWLIDYWRSGGMPSYGNWEPYAKDGATSADVIALISHHIPNPGFSWDDLARIREIWPHYLVLKGVLSPRDALQAKALGVDGLQVSNHGGRQFDRAPSALRMLPLIRESVGPEMPLLLDSGIMRGSDIVAALCLGADFVMVGRATLYGAIAAKTAGAARVIDILNSEIDMLMGQIGATTIADLGDDCVVK